MKKGFGLSHLVMSILVTAAAVNGLSSTAYAQEATQSTSPNAAVITLAQDLGPVEAEGDLVFDYDPSKIESKETAKPLPAGVVVPVSIDDPKLLANAQALSQDERNTFLRKKTAFLHRTGRMLGAIKIPATGINKLLDIMNKAFFNNAAVVANANTKVVNVQIGAALGAGLPDWLMKFIKRSPVFRNVPERVGFYFMAGAGFSIVTTMKNGRLKIGIEPVVEFRRATRIFSPFIFGAAGFTGAFTFENREPETSSIQKIEFYRLSSLNVYSNSEAFGFSGAAAIPFPPGGGAIAGMEGEIYRFRVTPSNFKQLTRDFISMLRPALRRCEALFL